MVDLGFYDRNKALTIRRGRLPHWRQDGALYFVTFRLADSIPGSKLRALQIERDLWLGLHPRNHTEAELEEYERFFVDRVEKWLDRGYGSCILNDPNARRIVVDALRHFDGTRYALRMDTVAPNHVHALLKTAEGVDLSQIEQSWKSYTSKKLLALPGLSSQFDGNRVWHAESFDHIVRNAEKLEKYEMYIRNHEMKTW